MEKIFYKWFCSIVMLAFLAGCRATYPKEKIEQSIKDICKKEYNVSVQTKISGDTIYAYVRIDALIPEIAALQKDVTDALSNVMNSLARVVLSSDYPFQFIVLHAVDTTSFGSYLTLVRYVDDIRRLLTGDISHDEYFNRLIIRSGKNPAAAPEFFTIKFFQNPQALYQVSHFKNRRMRIYIVENSASIKIDNNYYIVQCNLKEIIKTHSTIPCVSFSDYLIEVHVKADDPISHVYPLRYISDDGVCVEQSVPSSLARYIRASSWKHELSMSEVRLPDFLAEQISNRIKKELTENPRWTQKYIAHSVAGMFVPIDEVLPAHEIPEVSYRTTIQKIIFKNKISSFIIDKIKKIEALVRQYVPGIDVSPQRSEKNGIFEFTFNVQERIMFLLQKQIQPQLGVKRGDLFEDVNRDIIQQVLRRYGYHQFKEIRLINTNTGQKLTIQQRLSN